MHKYQALNFKLRKSKNAKYAANLVNSKNLSYAGQVAAARGDEEMINTTGHASTRHATGRRVSRKEGVVKLQEMANMMKPYGVRSVINYAYVYA